MSKYVDLVMCKHPNDNRYFLFQAPGWSFLKKGDDVMVDTQFGEQLAIVEDAIAVQEDSDNYNFIITGTRAKLPLRKVISKISYSEFNYPEEEENDGTNQD